MKRFILFVCGICILSSVLYSQNKSAIIAGAVRSIVQIKTDVFFGNGVCIGSNIVVCPISTIGKHSEGQIKFPNGRLYNIPGFTFVDDDNDFVLLKTDYDSATPIKMANYLPVIGQRVYLVNKNPDGTIVLEDGRLSNVKNFGNVKLLEVKAAAQFPSSGLPVLDSSGNMIALSVIPPVKDSSSNFSIPVELIEKAVQNQGSLRNLEQLQPYFDNSKQISFSEKRKSKTVSEFFDQGIAKLNNKDYQGAIEKFNMAIRVSPSDADAYAFRGQAKSQLMQYKDAMDDFNKALELQPDYAEVLDMRGVCKAELGDMTGACEDWKLSYEKGYNPVFKLIEKFCDLK